MTAWDVRSFVRALGATLMAVVLVWLVTAASDEGQLAIGVRAGRTLPLFPICGAAGVVLALGTARQKQEIHALETLGRSPAEIATAAVCGATLPSIVVAALLGLGVPRDVSAFYPRAVQADAFVYRDGAFESASLGVRVRPSGDLEPSSLVPADGDGLPRHAHGASALSTALSAVAFVVLGATAVQATSPSDARRRRRRRVEGAIALIATSLVTVVLFQAAAARVVDAWVGAVPPLLLTAALAIRAGAGARVPRTVAAR